MTNRRRMISGDWTNAALLLAVGFFLGLAGSNMVKLLGTPFWPLVILIPALFGGVVLFDMLLDRVVNRILPSGLKPATQPKTKERKPLALLFSLPAGFLIGLIGATLGLDKILL